MARVIEEGKSIFIPFKDGFSITDSQLHLRMYKTPEKFKRYFPPHTDYDALYEYAPVVHGEWEIVEDDWHSLTLMKCSLCHEEWCFEFEEETLQHYNFCPNCGADMRERKET